MRRFTLGSFLFPVTIAVAIIVVMLPFTSTHAQADIYRRWLDNGKTFTCTDMGSFIAVSLNNQDVEFSNLPPSAQYTLNYIDNGVNTPSSRPAALTPMGHFRRIFLPTR